LNEFQNKIKEGIIRLESENKSKDVYLLHHNDADGISSGYILDQIFKKKNYNVYRICLEKPYPKVIKSIHKNKGLIVYADFGSRMAPIISRLNNKKNLVLILDHHKPTKIKDKSIISINPMFHDIKGDKEISAAGVCYLFGKIWDKEMEKLSYLSLVGAIGDGHINNNSLSFIYQEIIDEAVNNNVIKFDNKNNNYYLVNTKKKIFLKEIENKITTLGALGYYSGGVKKAFDLINADFLDKDIINYKNQLEYKKNIAFNQLENDLKKGGLKYLEKIQWFDSKWFFHDFGVKTVGLFCSYLRKKEYIKKNCYIVGLQPLPPYIPQIGTISFSDYKVSVRCSKEMEQEIRMGKIFSIADILPEATKRVDGFIDACHSNAGATVIAIDRRDEFVKAFNNLAVQGY